MNFETEKQTVSAACVLHRASETQLSQAQINLPDYCKDIKRVLKCAVIPNISMVSRSAERITASGELIFRLIYVGDDEKLDCYEQTVDFTRHIEDKELPENVCVTAKAKTEYVNCRAASQRRAVVSAGLCVVFDLHYTKQLTVVKSFKDETVKTLKKTLGCVTSAAFGEKTFDMSETIEAPAEKKKPAKIICSSSTASLSSVKVVSGKLLIKGEMKVELVYREENDEAGIDSLEHTMPISQIIEIAGVDEKHTVSVSLSVQKLEVEIKSDSSGNKSMLELAARVSALVAMTRQSSVELVSDCYSTRYSCVPSQSTITLLSLEERVEKRQKQSILLDSGDIGASSVIYVRPTNTQTVCSARQSKVKFDISCTCELLYADKDGKLKLCERNAAITLEQQMKRPCDKISCEPVFIIDSMSFSLEPDGKLFVNVEYYLSADIFVHMSERVCTALAADEQKEKPPASGALTVCFCDAGDRIWDIAKKYGSDVQAICRENNINQQVLEQAGIVLVPGT